MMVGFIAFGTVLMAAGVWVGTQFEWAGGAALIAGGAAMAALGRRGYRQRLALEAQARAYRPLDNPLGGPPPAPVYEDADEPETDAEQPPSLAELYGGDRPDPGPLERSFPPRSRPYLVHTDGLVLVTHEGRLVIPWDAVRVIWHRKELTHPGPALCELALDGTREHVPLLGSRRQEELSAVIVDRTREGIIRRIREVYDREGKVRLGELTLTREGIYDADGGHLPWSGDWRIDGVPFPRAEAEGPWYNTVYVHSTDGRTLAAMVPELSTATGLLRELSGTASS
ncbi:hypothetical protein ACIBBB_24345 [Streptomyces sp. NPDC051217]|uniref:hypothetical protein n=1 Tax=Streptomyces sp. NPDC051217 TaxID=3365644 RepID=UPI00378D4CE8